jgi:MOSC domain-containing protein YiiM
MSGIVAAVCSRAGHPFSKSRVDQIRLVAGLGVEGDGHAGRTVQHRSRILKTPDAPNLRQVHLVHTELFDELAAFVLQPGDIGENIATRGIDLLALPTGAQLVIGTARIEITGLRNPCLQLDRFAPGLMKATLDRDADGALIRKAGVMGVVVQSGVVRAGDAIAVLLPPEPYQPLSPV